MKSKMSELVLKRKSKAGFTLIEVLVGVYILAFGLLGTISALASSSALVLQVQQNVIAAQIVQDVLESRRNMPYANIATVNPLPSGTTNFDKLNSPQGSLTVTSQGANMKKVTVTVSWQALAAQSGDTRRLSKTATTYIYNAGIDKQ